MENIRNLSSIVFSCENLSQVQLVQMLDEVGVPALQKRASTKRKAAASGQQPALQQPSKAKKLKSKSGCP